MIYELRQDVLFIVWMLPTYLLYFFTGNSSPQFGHPVRVGVIVRRAEEVGAARPHEPVHRRRGQHHLFEVLKTEKIMFVK